MTIRQIFAPREYGTFSDLALLLLRLACGSALVHDGVCIHAAFFANDGDARPTDGDRMVSPRQRRRFRGGEL